VGIVECPAKEETHERATFFRQPQAEAVGTHVRRQRNPDLVSQPSSARRLPVAFRCHLQATVRVGLRLVGSVIIFDYCHAVFHWAVGKLLSIRFRSHGVNRGRWGDKLVPP
jgi:hypothetical protein